MTTYAINSGKGVTVRVDYADVAGAYAGWFLLVVNGDNLVLSGTPADTAGFLTNTPVIQVGVVSTTGPSATRAGLWNSGGAGASADPNYRFAFLDQVAARLNKMLGEGHSAKWTATLVESVTPAVIDDSF
jgi:hypothetical protein